MMQPKNGRVFLALGATDMRKQINGLSILVSAHLGYDVLAGDWFAFCNRSRTTIKVVYYDVNGFCMWQKKLDKDRFRWPETKEEVQEIRPCEFDWLLAGLDIRHAHQSLNYSIMH